MKKRVMIIAAMAAVVGVIGLFLLTRPRVLGNMSSRCSEPTTETSDISFSGEAGLLCVRPEAGILFSHGTRFDIEF